MKTRYSKQRELIYENLKSRHDHPTAEAIYASLKVENPGLSLGTVYRNLNFLSEIDRIRKLDVGHDVIHFDADLHPHYHFICDSCHQVYDIDADIHEATCNEIQSKTEHIVKNAHITFTGICTNCQQNENN